MADHHSDMHAQRAQNQREKKINSNYSYESNEDYYDTCGHLLIIFGYLIMIITFPFLFFVYIRIARHYERIVVFRLGRLREVKGPGLCYIIPLIDRYKRVDLRLISFQIPTQEVVSKDKLSCEVDSMLFFRIKDPVQTIVSLENAKNSTKLLAQTTLRSVLGTCTIADMLACREQISKQIQSTLDHITNEWGIRIERFELKNIHLPAKLKQSLAAQTEASQESQAKLVAAEAEIKRSESLGRAANILNESPGGLQLRYLQSLDGLGADQRSNIVWPLPMEMMGSFYSSKSSLDFHSHSQENLINHREETNKKPHFEGRQNDHRQNEHRQPRPEVSSPPKVLRREQALTKPPYPAVATTQSSSTFVPITTNTVVPANSQPIAQSTLYRQQSVNNNENNSFMPPTNNNQQPQSFAQQMNYQSSGTARLPTPPVTSTINQNMNFARPSSATLTEICTSDDEEETQPIQRANQTPVFNYVH